MAAIEYKGTIDSICLIPISSVEFLFTQTNDNWIRLYEIESESSYSIKEITRMSDKGIEIVLGYRAEATIIVPHNLLGSNDLLTYLEAYQNKGRVRATSEADHFHVNIHLGGSDAINQNASTVIMLCNLNGPVGVSWAVESLELRHRLIIHLTGFQKSRNYLNN